MINTRKILAIATAAAILSGCAGTPVTLGTHLAGEVPTGSERSISSEACGFQLLLVIPISINDRMERAYSLLEGKAGSDFITDVKVKESWTYGLVGTEYCTALEAKAIHPK